MDLVTQLNEILQDYSDVKIAQMTGIERTRINRIRNGKFKIEFPELKKIVNSFVNNQDMAKKLYDAYLYEKLGKDKYYSRRLAKDFLTSMNFTELDENSFSEQFSKTNLTIDYDIPEENTVLSSGLAVKHAVMMIMSLAFSENDCIRIISSPEDEYIMSHVFLLTSIAPSLKIEHMFSLTSNNELTEPSTYYMEVAKVVYPIFMLNTNYRAYYTLIGHTTNALMPFHIVTSRFSISISTDSSSAVITKDKNVIELHKKLFDQKVKNTSTFINKITSAEEFLTHYCLFMEQTDLSKTNCFYSLDYEPCVMNFLNEDDFKICLKNSADNEKLTELLSKYINQLHPTFIWGRQISFFTKNGLRAFIETGEIAEIPESLGLEFDKARRKALLTQLLNHIKSGKTERKYYLLKENEFDPPLGLRFLGSGSKNDHLFIISNKKSGVRSILSFSNPYILSGVFDFIESLPETDMVYQQDEMIEYLEKTIAEI